MVKLQRRNITIQTDSCYHIWFSVEKSPRIDKQNKTKQKKQKQNIFQIISNYSKVTGHKGNI